MTEVRPGGNRRIDRVLAPDYLDNLMDRALAEIRAMRSEAEQEEADLSYLRRLLHGRIDIIQAEQRRRVSGETNSIVSQLPSILGREPRSPARGLGHLDTRAPSYPDKHRRRVEALVANIDLSDVVEASDEQLTTALATFVAEERAVSDLRRKVQYVVDKLSAEIARRYRDGEANVSELLEDDDRTH